MHETSQDIEPAERGLGHKTIWALGLLVVLGLAARFMPLLAQLLVILVILDYARHAWRTIAKIPVRQLGELVLVAGIALGAGFLFKLGVGGLIITGLFLLVTLPLWRLARPDPREEQLPAGSPKASGGERP